MPNFLDGFFSGLGGAQSAAGAPAVPPAPDPMGFGTTGLMGQDFSGSQFAGNAVAALGQSLLSSPSNDPLKGFGTALKGVTAKSESDNARQRLVEVLKQAGKTDIEIQAILASPQGFAALMSGGLGATPSPAAQPVAPAFGGLGGLSGGLGAPAPGTSFDPLLGPNSTHF